MKINELKKALYDAIIAKGSNATYRELEIADLIGRDLIEGSN